MVISLGSSTLNLTLEVNLFRSPVALFPMIHFQAHSPVCLDQARVGCIREIQEKYPVGNGTGSKLFSILPKAFGRPRAWERRSRCMFKVAVTMIILIGLFGNAQEESPKKPQLKMAITVIYSPEDFRYRSNEISPTLVYKKEFFQRFEPLSVGDILKRIPGISGSSDAGEFEKPQLRGIGPQYTQILVNGKRIPGSENDRTLFIDRIPAHMVKRLEVIRSPGSDMDAQGIGGTINIVLEDAGTLDGFNLLAGIMNMDQGSTTKGQGSVSYGHSIGNFAYSLSATVQQRYNPKKQFSDIFDSEDELLFKDETNFLEATESHFNGDATLGFAHGGVLKGRWVVFSSDREENEDASFFSGHSFQEGVFDHETIERDNWGAALEYDVPFGRATLFHVSLAHDRIDLRKHADFGSFDENEREIEEFETDRTEDSETKITTFFSLTHIENHFLKFGFDLSLKQRNARKRLFDITDDGFEEANIDGVFRVEERRMDPYFSDTWNINGRHVIQTGLRLEYTELELLDTSKKIRDPLLFPSIHYRFAITRSDQFRASIARTIKRRDFMDLQPFVERNQPRDGQDTVGNPNLEPELALGLDVGYEHRFAAHEGIIGLNLFFRNIDRRVEIVKFDENRFQPRNIDEGQVYGLELDAGFPLTRLGLPNLSVFANASFQDSSLTDPLSGEKRNFNLMSDFIFNLGWIHALPFWNVSYGLNFLSQGKAQEIFLNERVLIKYGDNLEIFLEKQWRKGLSLRLSGRNLLESERKEVVREYNGLWTEDELDATTFETEKSDRSLLLTFRGTFGSGRKK